jgi:hypothetical protein
MPTDRLHELTSAIIAGIKSGDIPIDWNGHHRNRSFPTDDRDSMDYLEHQVYAAIDIRWIFGSKEPGFVDRVEAASPESPVAITGFEHRMVCNECTNYLMMFYDGTCVRAAAIGTESLYKKEIPAPDYQRCPYPDGFPEYGPVIEIPSGVVAFADVLIDHPMKEPGADRGIEWARVATMNAGTVNIGYGFCGNTCPGVWVSDAKDEILIGAGAYVEETNEDIPIPGFSQVGGICTDLWWWTLADVQVLDELENAGHETYQVDGTAQVTPGRWKINQRYHLEDRDNTASQMVFARLSLIRD